MRKVKEVMNTSINIPTTGLVMGFVDQTEILLEYSVLAKLDIPPRYDPVGRVERHFILYRV